MTELVSRSFGPIPLTFGTGSIPVGSESTAQQVFVVNAVDHNVTVGIIEGYFNGILVACGSTLGDIIVRVYNEHGGSGQYEIYKAKFEFSAGSETLSDSLGAELVVFQGGCFITLEGSVASMEAMVYPYIMAGNTACKN